MIKWYIRKVVKEMILKGDLKFKLMKGENLVETPNNKYLKKYDTIKLHVTDKDGSPIAITETKMVDVVFDKSDIE
ncbi:hypothetical protein MHB40_14685 [Lysinibacillus sp. FSL K6-0057]|uniref:hypothetical protein n=1 Tax=Lysinibacillus sp. FSL K6-0057 TaxID=2921411 RepID=UPI00315A7231